MSLVINWNDKCSGWLLVLDYEMVTMVRVRDLLKVNTKTTMLLLKCVISGDC